MFMKLVLLFFLLTLSVPAIAAEPREEKLSSLVEVALNNNPELLSSSARSEMYRSKVKQAGAFDDPMLELKLQNGIVTDPLNFSRDAMTQKVIGVSQQLPYFGKRELRREVAAREADTFAYSFEERRLELIRMVKEAYYQIYFTDRALRIVDKNIGVMDTFITLAQTKYSVGQGAQQDIFKAQLEKSKMLEMRLSLEQQRKSQVINLNSLLYRPLDTPVGSIPDFTLPAPPPGSDALMEMARESRPALKSLKAQVGKGKSSYELAKKERYPDFNVMFEYMQRSPAMGSDGSDMYTVG